MTCSSTCTALHAASTATLASSGVAPYATLSLSLRARGGGGDGGSTGAESRSAYLEMYAAPKADAVDPEVTARAARTTCALTAAPLVEPIVADELGSLFNKVGERGGGWEGRARRWARFPLHPRPNLCPSSLAGRHCPRPARQILAQAAGPHLVPQTRA